MSLMRKLMFSVHRSELGFDETLAALQASAQEQGWDIPMVHDLQEGYHQAGYEDMTRLTTVYLCMPEGGYRILQDDDNKPLSALMPMGVSVYETSDGSVYVAGMDIKRMSAMFGGTVKEVFQQGGERYARTLDGIDAPKVDQQIEMDGGRCALGCLSVTALGVALVGALVWVMGKVIPLIMPKMMAKMMPQMIEMMEKAGVQPPCAQIILEHMEAEKDQVSS